MSRKSSTKNGFDSILSNWFSKILDNIHTSGKFWRVAVSLTASSRYAWNMQRCSFKINWIFRNTLEMNSSSYSSSIKQHRTGIILLKWLYCVGLFCMFSDWLCASVWVSVCLFSIALHLFYWLHAEYFFQFITWNRERGTQRKQLILFFCCAFFPRYIPCYFFVWLLLLIGDRMGVGACERTNSC